MSFAEKSSGVYSVVIIGAGPAGMAAAIKLYQRGITQILIVERNAELGGILNQCIHPGFGLSYFREDLTGPEYAVRLTENIRSLEIPYRLKTMVVDVKKRKTFSVVLASATGGREVVSAESVLVATGCRERTRENLLIPGTRPAGVYTAGQAQDLINIRGLSVGTRVVIQGSGDIGLIMARRLTIEGYDVVAVLERLPYLSGLVRNKVQCLDHFSIPLKLGSEIYRIDGRERVEGIATRALDNYFSPIPGKEEYIHCDTVLFSVGLIPELETAKSAGVRLKNGFNPVVDDAFQTNISGLFVCGNALHINDLADSASREGERVAKKIVEYLRSPQKFQQTRKNHLPYREAKKNTSFTAEYFDRLRKEGKLICIVCPLGCEVNGKEAGCEKGIAFYHAQQQNPGQRMATTVWADKKRSRRIPLVSRTEVSVDQILRLKQRLTNIEPGSVEDGVIKLEDEPPIVFQTYKAESQ